MPRKPRLHVDGAFYHVILRGNHRQAIFFNTDDRRRFTDLVASITERFEMRVHAFCLMSNHVHLAIQVGTVPLGRAMMRLASRYARGTQKRLGTTGHLFERRYRALLVDASEYLLTLVRYVHLNPVRAHLVEDPADYLWSGHRAYLGHQNLPWLTTDFVLSLFAADINTARVAYRQFILDGIGTPVGEQFMRGVRSEPRALGSDNFLTTLPATPTPRSRLSLDALIERVCAIHGISAAHVTAPGRSRSAAKVRVVILHHALRLRIASLSDVARRFNRSASTLSESLEHYGRTDPSILAISIDLSSS